MNTIAEAIPLAEIISSFHTFGFQSPKFYSDKLGIEPKHIKKIMDGAYSRLPEFKALKFPDDYNDTIDGSGKRKIQFTLSGSAKFLISFEDFRAKLSEPVEAAVVQKRVISEQVLEIIDSYTQTELDSLIKSEDPGAEGFVWFWRNAISDPKSRHWFLQTKDVRTGKTPNRLKKEFLEVFKTCYFEYQREFRRNRSKVKAR